MSMLTLLHGALLALDDKEAIRGALPDEQCLPGIPSQAVIGRSLASAIKADLVRVFDGKDGWDELAYLPEPGGAKRPYLVSRFHGRGHPFAPLFPGATNFMLLTPLTAYANLEHLHERSLEEHAKELEAVNRELVERTKNLAQAMNILEARNHQNIKELNLAVELQKSLLPAEYPKTDLVHFTHRYIPMAMVGGDFFNIVELGDKRIGVFISDVSGHGIAPAFITAMIRSAFDHLATPDKSPAQAMRLVNAEFAKMIDTDHFVTAFYAIFDFAAMSLCYCNAGHPAQLLVHADGTFAELSPDNPIIGMVDDFEYEDTSIALRHGDLLCFYTDGIPESRNANEELFGAEGIMRSLSEASGESLDGMADRIITDLIMYMKDPSFEDDITILLAQVPDCL